MAHIRKLKSGRWQASIRHPSGQRWSRTDPLKRVVAEWAAEQEARMRRGDFIDPAAGKMTLADWWAKWTTTRRVEAATIDKNASWWRNHIAPQFGPWPISSIHSWDVEAWVTKMVEREVGPETVASSLRLLSQLLTAAVNARPALLSTNVAALVTAPTPPSHIDRFLSHDEAERLLEQFTGADQLFVEFLLYTGVRWQEAAGLKVFRVDLLRKRIQVEKVRPRRGPDKKPKSRAGTRPVPLTDGLVLQLSRHITEPGEALVFTSPNGKPLRYPNWLRRVWAPGLAKARLANPQPTPHDLRHTYASWLADAGRPPHEIAAIMGHASLQSVQRYLHASEARFEGAREALGERQESGRSTEHHRAPSGTIGHISRSEEG